LEQLTGRHLLTECPCLNVGFPGSGLVEGVRASVKQHELNAHEMNGAEIGRAFPALRFPPDYTGVLEPAAGFLYVEECVRAHVDAAVSLGAEIHAEEPAREWKTLGDGVEVTTEKGTYRAAKLVVTAGAWATQLLADLGVPLSVMRQTLLWFDVGDHAAEFRRDTFPIFIADVPGGPFYGLPAIDHFGLKVARHYGTPELPNPGGMNWEVVDADVAAMRPLIDEYMPGLGALTKGQVCMYTVTPDKHFVMDVHRRHPQVSVACGFSGHGIKFASAVGVVLADLAETGKTRHAIEMFSARRFQA
jgi:sarcosine oxidase